MAALPGATMYLKNLKTGDKLTPQGNPPQWVYEIKVQYNRLDIGGLSHKVKQYDHTDDVVIPPLDFEFVADTADERKSIDAQMNTLNSWCYADQAADIGGGAPPRVLVLWPKIASLSMVIVSLKVTIKEQSPEDGMPSWVVASVAMEEISDARILPQLVKSVGLNRYQGA